MGGTSRAARDLSLMHDRAARHRGMIFGVFAILLLAFLSPVMAGGLRLTGVVFGSAIVLSGPCGAAPKIGSTCTVPEEPAVGVELLLWAFDRRIKDTFVRTDEKGRFRVELPLGSYEVRLARPASPWIIAPLRFSVKVGDKINLIIPLQLLRG